MPIDLFVGPCKSCGSKFNPVNKSGLCFDCFQASKAATNRVQLINESGAVVAEFPRSMTVGQARKELKRSSLAAHCNWKFRLVREVAVA